MTGIRSETTEIYSAATNVFSYGPVLPIYLERHCMAKIDDDKYVVAGEFMFVLFQVWNKLLAWQINYMSQETYFFFNKRKHYYVAS